MYNSGVTSGGLLLRESRVMAALLLGGTPKEELISLVISENLLQKRSPATLRKITQLVAKRLFSVTPSAWEIIAQADKIAASQLLLAVIATEHRIVGDFLIYLQKEFIALYKHQITVKDWDAYFEQCIMLEPNLALWKESTVKKIRSLTFTILTDCAVFDTATIKNIHRLQLSRDVITYLDENNLLYAGVCLRGIA